MVPFLEKLKCSKEKYFHPTSFFPPHESFFSGSSVPSPLLPGL